MKATTGAATAKSFDAPSPVKSGSGAAAYLLALLTLVGAVNSLNRTIFGVVLQSIKNEMHASDTVMGLVAGLAFALFYAFMGMPIAYLSDRHNRRNIIVIGMTFWSAMTCLTGLAANIWQLAVVRFLMGAGEASSGPPSNAMVADLYPKEKRPFVLGILWAGASLGGMVALMGGGWVNQHYGWRTAFIWSGIPGFLLAGLLLLTREPVRGASERGKVSLETSPFWGTIGFLCGSRTYMLLAVGGVVMAIGMSAQGAWAVPFMIRVHHFSSAQAGAFLGLNRLASLPGYLLGGYLATALSRWDERWRVWVPALGCLLGVPAGVLFVFSNVNWIMFVGCALMSFLGAMHFGPLMAVCQSVVKVRMRAVAVAVFIFMVNFIGQIVGPLGVGLMNDKMGHLYGTDAIRYSMLWFGTLVGFGAGVLMWMGARHLAPDTERALQA
jgi:MFS family permease